MGFFDGLGSALIGGVSSLLGGSLQQSSARKQQKENNDLQVQLANTSHQREVADLQAAGLNPILSARFGGSATPPTQAGPTNNVLEQASNSALKYATLKATVDNIEADTAQKTTQAGLNVEAAKNAVETNALIREQIQKTVADYWHTDALKHFVYQNTANAKEQQNIMRSQAKIYGVSGDYAEDFGYIQKLAHGGISTARNALGGLQDAKNLFRKYTPSPVLKLFTK